MDDAYIECRLKTGGLRLVHGSATMLQDEFERFERERTAETEPATPPIAGEE